MTSFHDITTAVLKQAVQIREEISSLQERLGSLLGGSSTTAKKKVGRPSGKRTMSAETVAKMRIAQKARWAKVKSPAKTVAKKKQGITPEGQAKLAAAMKARWAARKKGAPALNVSTK
jgi:hypothetical protein